MEGWAYGLRRDLATFDQASSATSDRLFAGERLDEKQLPPGTFQHCTFANISFLRAQIRNVTFVDCVFIGCYFRRAVVSSCSFTSCRFISCDFTHIAINGTNLLFAKFVDCTMDYEVVRHNLPNEHNLREDLCRNLAVEATKLGHLSQARAFRLEEVKAKEANLRSALLWRTDWYRQHYYGTRRARAGLELVWSLLNRFMWGHGERLHVLVRNAALFTLVVLPLLLWKFRSGLRIAAHQDLHWSDFIYLSLQTVLPVNLGLDVSPTSLAARAVTVIGSVSGLVFAGLFVAYLLRWILRR
jgi:uncharacterized protein YjbI with pentapeptide repeats